MDTGSDCVWLKNFTVSPLYTLTIAPDQTDATVTLKDKEGKTVSGSNGVFAVKAAADYTYTVTKKGYEPATGKVTMSAENQTVNVTLVKLPVITLTVSPADATVKLTKNGSTVSHDAKNGGEYKYIAAKNTAYTYTVSKFGYETATGTIKVETGDVNKTVTLTEAAKYSVTFQITKPEGVNAEPPSPSIPAVSPPTRATARTALSPPGNIPTRPSWMAAIPCLGVLWSRLPRP